MQRRSGFLTDILLWDLGCRPVSEGGGKEFKRPEAKERNMEKGHRKKIAQIFFTIALCVICDQTAKAIARTYLPRLGMLSFAGETVKLQYAENRGAVLSFES